MKQDGARRGDRLIHPSARYLLKGNDGMATVAKTGVYRDASGNALYLVAGENVADDIAARYTLDDNGKSGAPQNRAEPAAPQTRARRATDAD